MHILNITEEVAASARQTQGSLARLHCRQGRGGQPRPNQTQKTRKTQGRGEEALRASQFRGVQKT
eukprot:214629-Hanusia_phi.AAC.1